MSPKSTIKYLIAAIIILFGAALLTKAQTPAKAPESTVITVKSSPAEDALVGASKDAIESRKKFDQMSQDAQNGLFVNQKKLVDDLTAKQKAMIEKIKADKKYKAMIDEIDGLQKQLQNMQGDVRGRFAQQTAPLQQKIASDNAAVETLIPIVKKDNNLPDNAVFDKEKQTWSAPKAADKK